jgi:hypothetical protein
MVQQQVRASSRRIGVTSRMDAEFFCRDCKGHYSASVPVGTLNDMRCRCGSRNLLIYNVAGEYGAPLRYR